MSEIKSVAVLGAGAVGSYVLWGLRKKLGERLCIIAEGERADRLKKNGIIANGDKLNIPVRTAEEAGKQDGPDLLVVTLKYGSLRDALPQIAETVGTHTIVMSLMNGIDSEEIIADVVPKEQILYSFIKIASQRVGNEVRFKPPAGENYGIFFGETSGETSERVQAVYNLFEDTPIVRHISDRILQSIWTKFALNIAFNIPQAMVGCGLGAYRDSRYVKDMQDQLLDEVMQVAAAKEIHIIREEALRASVSDAGRFSTLQDLDAGRHTEIDMLCGAMISMGEECGIPTPYNRMAYDMIHALEEKNDGKFNY